MHASAAPTRRVSEGIRRVPRLRVGLVQPIHARPIRECRLDRRDVDFNLLDALAKHGLEVFEQSDGHRYTLAAEASRNAFSA